MKGKYTGILAAAVCGSMLLSGCSFSGMVNRLTGNEGESVVSSSSAITEATATGLKVDETVQAPVFQTDLTGTTTTVLNTEINLSQEAAVTDGGTVTYQWYVNDVNQNGGGTAIAGATDTTVTVDTSEAKHSYYYCVATNTIDDRVNMSVSAVREINTIAAGSWQQDDTGYKYVLEDGTFPSSTQFIEGGKLYTLNDQGYRTDDGQDAPSTIIGAAIDSANQQAAEQDAAGRSTDAQQTDTGSSSQGTDAGTQQETTDAAAQQTDGGTQQSTGTDQTNTNAQQNTGTGQTSTNAQ